MTPSHPSAKNNQYYRWVRVTAIVVEVHACAEPTARAPLFTTGRASTSWQRDSNPQPPDYKSGALPVAPCQHAPLPVGAAAHHDTRRAETGGTPSGVFWHRRAVRACQNTPLERWDCRTGAGQLADGLGVELADGVELAAPLADPPAATMAALSAPVTRQS